MAGNNGGPWGGGGGNRGGGRDNDEDDRGSRPPRRRPPEGQALPEIDEIVRKGQEQLKVLMGGRGGGGGNRGGGGGGGSPFFTSGAAVLGVAVLAVVWAFFSFYRVDTSEESIELLFGKYAQTGTEGLNFAPWPIVTYEKFPVTRINTMEIGVRSGSSGDDGLMLTGDENIVDIDFTVQWNVANLVDFKFNLSHPEDTIRAVSESAMREIVARSNLAPILNRDRGAIEAELQQLVQDTLDSYQAGVRIVVVNFDKADPPRDVIDAFREVQAAEQTRDTLEKQADAYSNQVVAGARGEAAQKLEEAEGYRARVVNEAEGEASRFLAVYEEYAKAKEVTRRRLYIETIEDVLGGANKVIIDEQGGSGQGVVPYLPLNQLTPGTTRNSGGSN